MTQPFTDLRFDDDLHLLMAVAVLSGQHGVQCNQLPTYEAWSRCYPEDALGPIGLGLSLISSGSVDEGIAIIASAASTSKTRADQAQDVLQSVKVNFAAMAS